MASEFAGKSADIATLGGEKIRVSEKDGSVTVGAATVSAAALSATNGVIHVIDTVLMPT
jgi:transforming growth factor-beta-induced protein